MVVNADSQQVYDTWRVLTARPDKAEMGDVPHHLFGHVPLTEAYSTGHWLRDVRPLLDRPVVIAGGTGLYFKALTEGLAPVPPVPPEVRQAAENDLARMGSEAFADRLRREDPETAERIDLSNPRRVVRAWEVLVASGTGLAAWQDRTPPPALDPARAVRIALAPDREWLYRRCDLRFDRMMEGGAVEEVRAVMALDLPPDAPGLKALGAPELMAWQRGELDRESAVARAKMETRRYAKRQTTWIRNQMADWTYLAEPDVAAVLAKLRD